MKEEVRKQLEQLENRLEKMVRKRLDGMLEKLKQEVYGELGSLRERMNDLEAQSGELAKVDQQKMLMNGWLLGALHVLACVPWEPMKVMAMIEHWFGTARWTLPKGLDIDVWCKETLQNAISDRQEACPEFCQKLDALIKHRAIGGDD